MTSTISTSPPRAPATSLASAAISIMAARLESGRRRRCRLLACSSSASPSVRDALQRCQPALSDCCILASVSAAAAHSAAPALVLAIQCHLVVVAVGIGMAIQKCRLIEHVACRLHGAGERGELYCAGVRATPEHTRGRGGPTRAYEPEARGEKYASPLIYFINESLTAHSNGRTASARGRRAPHWARYALRARRALSSGTPVEEPNQLQHLAGDARSTRPSTRRGGSPTSLTVRRGPFSRRAPGRHGGRPTLHYMYPAELPTSWTRAPPASAGGAGPPPEAPPRSRLAGAWVPPRG